tara:strand:- start:313 stop:1764 length:1452 start_codon:yes stop_codon:yes gene_type:complete
MKKIIIHSFFVILLSSLLFPKNLTLYDFDNPSASHILDTEIIDNILIVSGMIGGIEFYDISNPEVLNHLTTLQLSSGGGGGGQGGGGTKPNCIVASGNYAYVTTNRGLGVINISNPSNPQYLGIVPGTDNYMLEDLDINSNFLAVAAHQDGTLLFNISNPGNPVFLLSIEGENVWTVHLSNDYLYIGDESLLNIYMIVNDAFGEFLDYAEVLNVNLGNSIKDIETGHYQNYIFVAIGSDGVVLIDSSNLIDGYGLINYEILGIYNTTALANKIDFMEDVLYTQRLAVSDWDDVEILEWNGESLSLVGFKNTTRRTMAIATKNDYIYSAEWNSVQIFEYGEIDGPDLDLNLYELNYPYVQLGESYNLSLEVTNNGSQTLSILDAYTTNNEFSYSELNDLNPGESQIVDILYTADSNNASGSYRIFSNDEDEPQIVCETNGNINGANIGDIAPNFNLDIIANGSGSFELSDYINKIVVLAFFAPN